MPGLDAALADWQVFFAGQLGAGATLVGLLFVGLSLNLARILAAPTLPLRAEIALILVMLQLVVASLALIPGQPALAFGIEAAAVAGLVWCVTAWLSLRMLRAGPGWRTRQAANFALLQAAVLPLLAGGLLAAFERPAGLGLIAAGMILCIVKATLDAWVLLVEINR
jgi:hypothetical protein